jgi:ribbon-helix-helix CopG family protein
MSKKRAAHMTTIRSFKIDPETAAALRRIREEEGISESWQIRRGIDLWLRSRDVIRRSKPKSPGGKRDGDS